MKTSSIILTILAIASLMFASCSTHKKKGVTKSEEKIVSKMHKWDHNANQANKVINDNIKSRKANKEQAVENQLAIQENLKELNKPKQVKKARNNGYVNNNTAFNFY